MGGIAALTKVLTKSSSKKSTRKGLTAAEKKKINKMFSEQTGAGRQRFAGGNPPRPKIEEGMARGTAKGNPKAEAEVDAGLAGKVTMTADPNFIKQQATKSTKKAAENRVKVFKLAEDGDKKAKTIKTKIVAAEKKANQSKANATSTSLRNRKIYEKGEYMNRNTGELITNPKRASDFPDGGPKAYDFNPTAKRMESIRKNLKSRDMSKRERELEAMKVKELKSNIKSSKTPGKSSNVVGKGGGRFNEGGLSTKDYGKAGGYNMGGLATPTPKQTGLKKLPTGVRNKMGYMYGGGMANKKMGSTDYRKGGLVIMITGGKPMKNKKGTK